MKVIGDTSIPRHFTSMLVHFLEPIGGMIHVRILIMHPRSHFVRKERTRFPGFSNMLILELWETYCFYLKQEMVKL